MDLTSRTHKSHNYLVKKIKSSDSYESLTPVSDLLDPAKDLISSASQYPLSYNQTTEFMDKVLGTSDVLGLIRMYYTEDVAGVPHLLYDVYPVVTHTSIKNSCRKVDRKIKKGLQLEKKLS